VFASFFKKIWRRNKPLASRTTAQIGRDGEDAAVKHLSRLGFQVVERNWSCKAGEMDIICRHQNAWVFVEVKASRRLTEFPPETRVNQDKRRRLHTLARFYLGHKYGVVPYRFDVISVWWEHDDVKIRHIENAF
jgi:putative endonuclease